MNDISDHKKKKKTYFLNLYGLRFVAALFIFVFHAFTLFRENWIDIHESRLYSYFISKGQLGVNLFFILSGFLISYLALEKNSDAQPYTGWRFLKQRSLRILPLYFLFVGFCYLLFPLAPWGETPIYDISSFYSFTFNFEEIETGALDHLNYLTPLWTIAVECQYYFLVALILFLFRKKTAIAFYLLYPLLIVVSLIFRFLHGEETDIIYYHSFSVMSDFGIGGLLAVSYYQNKIQRYFKSLNLPIRLGVYLVILSMLLFQYQIFTPALRWGERFVIGLAFGFILIDLITNSKKTFFLEHNNFIRKMGISSYGFYVYHVFVLYTLTSLTLYFDLSYSPLLLFLYISLSLFISLGWAKISYRYFELPIQNYLRKKDIKL